MTNDVPYFIFSCACDLGKLDHLSKRSFAESLLVVENGAYATIMNTKYGWYSSWGSIEYSQFFQYNFILSSVGVKSFRNKTYDIKYTIGDIYEEMRKLSLSVVKSSSENLYYYCFLTPALYGDPALSLYPYSYTNVPSLYSN